MAGEEEKEIGLKGWSYAQLADYLYAEYDFHKRNNSLSADLSWIGEVISNWGDNEDYSIQQWLKAAVPREGLETVGTAFSKSESLQRVIKADTDKERDFKRGKYLQTDVLPGLVNELKSLDDGDDEDGWVTNPTALSRDAFLTIALPADTWFPRDDRQQEAAPAPRDPRTNPLLGRSGITTEEMQAQNEQFQFGGHTNIGTTTREHTLQGERDWRAGLSDSERDEVFNQMLTDFWPEVEADKDWDYDTMLQALTATPQSGRTARYQRTRLENDLWAIAEQRAVEVAQGEGLEQSDQNFSTDFTPSQTYGAGRGGQGASELATRYLMQKRQLELGAQGGGGRVAPKINYIDPATLRSLADQQFRSKVGRKASASELASFVQGIHAAQKSGLTGASLDPVARAGEFATESDKWGASAVKKANAGRTISQALRGMMG